VAVAASSLGIASHRLMPLALSAAPLLGDASARGRLTREHTP
jgi:hypothetical protein